MRTAIIVGFEVVGLAALLYAAARDMGHRTRVAVYAYLRERPGEWVTTLELLDLFGHGVYPALRRLHAEKRLERRENESQEAMARRHGYPEVSYRFMGSGSWSRNP